MKFQFLRVLSVSALTAVALTGGASAQSMDKLIADAKAEGMLTTIALPPTGTELTVSTPHLLTKPKTDATNY